MPKPRGRKGGRKPSLSPPKDKRTAQLRASQVAFRKRKLERLAELERKESQLTKLQYENLILTKEKGILFLMLKNLLTGQTLASNKKNICEVSCTNRSSPDIIVGDNILVPTMHFSSETHKCYAFFSELLPVCGRKKCVLPSSLDCNARPIRPGDCANLFTDLLENSFANNLLNENRGFFDFNMEYDELFYPPNETQLTDTTASVGEMLSSLETELESKVNYRGVDLDKCHATDMFESDVLLRAIDIWHFMRTHSKAHALDFEKLGKKLKKHAICSDFDILISLKQFITIFSSNL